MKAIQVRELCKTFTTKRKSAGLSGSLRALVHPDWQEVHAVRGISFELKDGEAVGFIGPNGAGKSTTIKMLTGILYPTSGEADVLGFVPWQQRRELSYRVGTVFGQRSQLWYHLPAIDTLNLFGKIYELDTQTIRQRIGFLSEVFETKDLLETPVRKLSLGQRVRCELIASLLHSPPLLLLDEPSIGLDVVAKQRIRDAIRQMNEIENVSVLLTSHDAGDVEALCKRVVIIHKGQIVYNDTLSLLKQRHLTAKVIQARYVEEIPASFDIPHTEIIDVERYSVKLRLDTTQMPIGVAMTELATLGNLVDISITEPSLEKIIRAIFKKLGDTGEMPI